MANTIKLKRGTSTPSTSDISSGEVAIDTSAKKLYINDSGTVKEIGGSGTIGGASGIDFNDSVKVRFGTGNDTELYFDGVNTYLKNTPASSFYIQSGGNLLLENTNGENYVKGVANGEVLLYHNGTEKFSTTSYGNASAGQVRVTSSNATTPAFSVGDSGTGFYNTGTNAIGYSANGTQKWNINSSGDLRLVDSVKANFGTGDDLQLFHDGTGCNIRSTSSKLEIRSPDLLLQNSGAEKYFRGVSDGAVELYYDNAKKFETHSGGCIWTGDLYGLDNARVSFGNSNDLLIYHDGSHNYLYADNGELKNRAAIWKVVNEANSEIQIKATENSAVELYYDNARKLRTTSTGIAVEDHIDMDDNHRLRLGSSSDLQIWHTGSHSYVQDSGTGALVVDASELRVNNAADTEHLFKALENSNVILYYDNSEKIRTTSSGARMGDSSYLYFGAGEDMFIGHDGSNSYLKAVSGGTGDMYIFADGKTIFLRPKSGEDGVKVIPDGAVELYHNGVKKFSTYAYGTLMPDDTYSYMGNSGDMWMGFSGSAGHLKNGTGVFYLRADDLRLNNAANGEQFFRGINNAETQLFYDNSKKLATDSGGVNITGGLNASGNIVCTADSGKFIAGAGDDLRLFHDGSNNYLRGYTAGQALYIDSLQDIRLRAGDNAGSYQNSIYMDNNGGVHCYYDNSKKMETYSGGCIFQGNIKADQDDATLVLGASSDIQMWHGSGDSTLKNFTGDFQILCTGDDINIKAADDIRLKPQGDEAGVYVYGNGKVELYYDNSKKLETTASGVNVTSGHLYPNSDNTHDLGTAGNRWRNVYTNDLHLSNQGHSNDVDGTWGSFTIQEGAEDLFLMNKRNGKKYKFNLTEVT